MQLPMTPYLHLGNLSRGLYLFLLKNLIFLSPYLLISLIPQLSFADGQDYYFGVVGRYFVDLYSRNLRNSILLENDWLNSFEDNPGYICRLDLPLSIWIMYNLKQDRSTFPPQNIVLVTVSTSFFWLLEILTCWTDSKSVISSLISQD